MSVTERAAATSHAPPRGRNSISVDVGVDAALVGSARVLPWHAAVSMFDVFQIFVLRSRRIALVRASVNRERTVTAACIARSCQQAPPCDEFLRSRYAPSLVNSRLQPAAICRDLTQRSTSTRDVLECFTLMYRPALSNHSTLVWSTTAESRVLRMKLALETITSD